MWYGDGWSKKVEILFNDKTRLWKFCLFENRGLYQFYLLLGARLGDRFPRMRVHLNLNIVKEPMGNICGDS